MGEQLTMPAIWKSKKAPIINTVLFGSFIILFTYIVVAALVMEFATYRALGWAQHYVLGVWDRIVKCIILLCLCAVCALVLWAVHKNLLMLKPSVRKVLFFLLLLVIAYAPRLVLALTYPCTPINDFANYRNLGLFMLHGDAEMIRMIVEKSRIPEFFAISIFNGFLMLFTGESLIAFQAANGFVTACICLLVFYLGSYVDVKVGIVAFVLMAFYPSNIVFSLTPTNQHGAIFFLLIAILIFLHLQKAVRHGTSIKKTAIYALGCGLFLFFSNCMHPSALLFVIAFTCAGLCLALAAWKGGDRSGVKHAVSSVIFICVVFVVCNQSFLLIGSRLGYIVTPEFDATTYAKILIGTNTESQGQWNADDIELSFLHPDADAAKQAFLNEMKQRLLDPVAMGKLLAYKPVRMWTADDWAPQYAMQGHEEYIKNVGLAEELQPHDAYYTQALQGALAMDKWFCIFIYVMAVAGACLCMRSSLSAPTQIFMWCIMAWVGCHVFIEIQTRYRYAVMPLIMIFSAVSIVFFAKKAHGFFTSRFLKSTGKV